MNIEKLIKAIDVLVGVGKHVSAVLVAVFGTKGIIIALGNLDIPFVKQKLVFTLFLVTLFAVLKVFFELIDAITSTFVSSNNNKYKIILFCVGMSVYLIILNPIIGLITAIGFVTIGGMIPVSNTMNSETLQMAYSVENSKLTALVRDITAGLPDIIQYRADDTTLKMVDTLSRRVEIIKGKHLNLLKHKHMMLVVARLAFALIIVAAALVISSKNRMSMEKMLVVLAAAVFSIREVGIISVK